MLDTLDADEYQMLLNRVEALEQKLEASLTRSRRLEIPMDAAESLRNLTESVFGHAARIECQHGDAGEDDYVLVSVEVGDDADPRDMAKKHSAWHKQVMASSLRDKDRICLKVTYK